MIVNLKNNNKYFERTDTLVKYYKDIRGLNSGLSADEEKKFFKLYKYGNDEERKYAKKVIIESNQKFVVSVARYYANNNNIMDIINEGNIGLLKAIDAYDENFVAHGKSVKFTTFAVHYIRREINEYRINVDSMIKKNNIAKTYHILSQARNKFLQDNGRQPTSDELKDFVNKVYGLNLKKSIDVLDLKFSRIDDVNNDENENNLGTLYTFNAYSSNKNNFEDVEANEYNKAKVASLLNVLTPREQEIIKMSFGIGEIRELTSEEISEKLDITSERVRQLKNSIMEKLKREFKKTINERL